jgi:hypothetical protein|tara:strand:+ start:2057 stop:2362 length:306 start_codon:yes stop_codon:yes gene_type:complete
MNYIGSINYTPSGRKRKSKALKTRRKTQQVFVPLKVEKSIAELRMEEFNSKYQSRSIDTKHETSIDQSWKIEESKNFTVAPAFNKGAYQVIPRTDVEHIGK